MTDVRPRPRQSPEASARPDSQRSSVSLWRSTNGKPKWSVRIVAGTTEAEVDELVALALRAEHRLTGPQP